MVTCRALGYTHPTPHLLYPSHLFQPLIISASQMSTQRLWEVRLPTSHSRCGVRQIPTQAESRDWPSDKQEDSRMQIPSALGSSWWSETHFLSCPWSWLLSGVHLWVGLAWQEDNAQVDSSWLLMNWLNNCSFPHRNASVLILKSTHPQRIHGYPDVYLSKAGVCQLPSCGVEASGKGDVRRSRFETKHGAQRQVSWPLFSRLNIGGKNPYI